MKFNCYILLPVQTNKTFANIPTDVFDQIPRAVTAREEKRLVKLQERLLQEKRVSEQEEDQVRKFELFNTL